MMANKSIFVMTTTLLLWLSSFQSFLKVVSSLNPQDPYKGRRRLPKSESSTTTSSSSPSTTHDPAATTRRQWLMTMTAIVTTTTTTMFSPQITQAACLQGDSSTECIGVYKVPIDERILPYISTPEALSKFAPDIHWVPPITPPSNIPMAWDQWNIQRMNILQELIPSVQQGRLEEAGINLLKILPILTVILTMILDDAIVQVYKNQEQPEQEQAVTDGDGRGGGGEDGTRSSPSPLTTLITDKLEIQCALALGLWGETDIMIGQALRGELGVSAVAQFMILKQLQEALCALDDFGALVSAVTGRTYPMTPSSSSTSTPSSTSSSDDGRRPLRK